MSATATNYVPIRETVAPNDSAEAAEQIRQSASEKSAVYPVGGGTSLDYGLPGKKNGLGLSLAGMNKVLDYPARDMTVTVQSGITMQTLSELLRSENQRLPLDVPHAKEATLGGVVATNYNGPRRFGSGTVRDYVIGIQAVDGRGMVFSGGGRVVKNVAGYDFCKLLTGSMGTIGAITQVTMKVVPIPESSAFTLCPVRSWDEAESVLAATAASRVTPAAVEFLSGPAWREGVLSAFSKNQTLGCVAVGLEGSSPEVSWMKEQLASDWKAAGACDVEHLSPRDVPALWKELTDFTAQETPLLLKAALLPNKIANYTKMLTEFDPEVNVMSHAGSGILFASFSKFAGSDVAKSLIGRFQPAAIHAGGHAVVYSSTLRNELTRQAVWGPLGEEASVMRTVKKQFDPEGILNPGRFVFE